MQGAPDGGGGWYCELVSERYLPATVRPIDHWYLIAADWTPPTNPDDNWSHTAADPTTAAQVLVDGLRHGRACQDWQQVIWHTARFPAPPGGQGPGDEPMLPAAPVPVPV